MDTCNEIGIQDANELPVFEQSSLVDYYFAIANVVNKHSGDVVPQAGWVPAEAVVPYGGNANVFTLEANNASFTVPSGQVVPAYVQSGNSNPVLVADSANHCDFLALSAEAGLVRAQSTGVAFFPGGHEYKVIGAQYYLSKTPGQVTTNASETGRKLFKVLSRTQILINM